MKKIFTLLALTISFSMNAQMDDNSSIQFRTYAVAMGIAQQQVELFYSNGIDTTASGVFYSNGK